MATQYIQDQEGNTFIASTQRADGSFRKPRKVKQGFVPQEEVPLYESKGKKIAKEAKENEGLPAGLTREAWEKMKEAQANLLNTQQKAAKKKNNKKKTPNQTNENQLNNQIDENKTSAAAKKKKNKNKTQQNNENNSATVNNTTSISPTNEKPVDDDWVTMGKSKPKPQQQQKSNLDKATSGVKNLSLNSKQKNKQSQQQSKPTIDDLPISKEVDDLASGMLIDDYHEDEHKEKEKLEKNNEKQLLIKKIKTLKKKLKDVESLKELAKQKSLDKDQQQKLNKSGDFAKELTKLQSKLELINKDK